MTTEDDRARWYVFQSADAVATRSMSTEEVVELYDRGALRDQTVIHHRFESRRQGITVAELVARVRQKKK